MDNEQPTGNEEAGMEPVVHPFLLASIIDTLQDAVITMDLDGRVTSWNKSAARIYGYSEPEILGQSMSRIIAPDDFDVFLQTINAIKDGQTVPGYDTLMVHKDGSTMELELTISPITNRANKLAGISAIARDVCELRKTRQALTHSENRLKALLEAAIDFSIITLDQDGMIMDWNTGAERMFGYSRNEVIGRYTGILFTPEDRQANVPHVELEVAKKTGRSINERWHLKKDGTRFFMSGVMSPIRDSHGGNFVKIARNITDRKLAEEALALSEQQKSLAVQSAGLGEWEWDLATDLVKVSDQTALLLGWGHDRSEATTQELRAQVYPLDERVLREALRVAFDGLNIFQAEFRLIRADNQQRSWVNIYGRVIAYTDGRASKMIGVLYDITSRKQLEKQKEDFISVASHELKTPVTAIKAYSEILEEHLENTSNDNELGVLKKLNKQVDRLSHLIETLLDASNMTEGKMRLNPERVDLNAMISEHIESLQTHALKHDIRCKFGPASPVNADRGRILQVISNFISNAVKYSPPTGTVMIETEDKLDHVVVSVQDSGPGIPKDVQPFLFDRYYRVPGKSIQQEGFGLGLYICSEIIKQHFGVIGVESAPGHGAKFYFTLPYS